MLRTLKCQKSLRYVGNFICLPFKANTPISRFLSKSLRSVRGVFHQCEITHILQLRKGHSVHFVKITCTGEQCAKQHFRCSSNLQSFQNNKNQSARRQRSSEQENKPTCVSSLSVENKHPFARRIACFKVELRSTYCQCSSVHRSSTVVF